MDILRKKDWRFATDASASLESRRKSWPAKSAKLGQFVHAGLLRDWRGFTQYRIVDYYALVYTLEGSCLHISADGTRRVVPAGGLFMNFPGVPHEYGPAKGSRWSQVFCAFRGPIFDLWRSTGALDPNRGIIMLQPVDYWLDRFESVINSVPPDDGSDLRALSGLQMLLAEILASAEPRPSEEQEHWLARAQTALSNVARADELDMQQIAAHLSMSYANFRRRFGKLAGISPARYHATALMKRACRVLEERKCTDRQLAEQLGYADAYHFSRRFRQIIGMAPREFRKAMGRPADRKAAE